MGRHYNHNIAPLKESTVTLKSPRDTINPVLVYKIKSAALYKRGTETCATSPIRKNDCVDIGICFIKKVKNGLRDWINLRLIFKAIGGAG